MLFTRLSTTKEEDAAIIPEMGFIVNFSKGSCRQYPLRDYYLNNGLLDVRDTVFQKCFFLSISRIFFSQRIFVYVMYVFLAVGSVHTNRGLPSPYVVDKIVTFGGDLLQNGPFGLRIRFIL